MDVTTPVDEINDETSSVADVCDPEKYREVFRPKHKLSKSTRVLNEIFSNVLCSFCSCNAFQCI